MNNEDQRETRTAGPTRGILFRAALIGTVAVAVAAGVAVTAQAIKVTPTASGATAPVELPTTLPTQLPKIVPTTLPTALPTELPTALPTARPSLPVEVWDCKQAVDRAIAVLKERLPAAVTTASCENGTLTASAVVAGRVTVLVEAARGTTGANICVGADRCETTSFGPLAMSSAGGGQVKLLRADGVLINASVQVADLPVPALGLEQLGPLVEAFAGKV